ncbi:hypothetical protein CISG_01470 [Coccidioides immitis RMSCC 3703]|uniref:RRN7-type domain-containing protein n=1 Tax=Coccidioides immitis RMSCC 3703 TaxID=454286 RepID=A0A0J8QXU3_COCIT|nr:hypothetical protein CISG_01470 [Coccidioides immitis RMSCC 3703]
MVLQTGASGGGIAQLLPLERIQGRQVIADDDDFGTQGRTIRQKKVTAERLSKKYSGSQAYQLFLEAYQLLLWKQCHALINQRGLPGELELIVKDLWALRLQKLYEREDDNYRSDDNISQLFSSQTEWTELDDEEYRYHRRKLSDSPKVIDAVALCYLGTLLLRIPVSIGYMQRWIVRDDIPFLRLSRFVPQDMKERLPAVYHNVLDPRNVPTGDQLHRAVADLADLYSRDFGVTFPRINLPLLLFSYIKQLALPLEIYPAVSRLKELSGFEFCFSRQPGRFNRVSLPEVQLMSLVIIAAKLLYPLDDIKRYPDSLQDPAAQIIDWEAWVETQKEFDLRGKNTERLTRGCEIKVDESDVLQMTPAQLDDYMDWYSKMWIDTKKGTNPFADMFQTDRVDTDEVNPMPPPDDDDDGPEISKKLHKMLSRMKMRRVVADADVMALAEPVARPGSSL